VLDRAEILAVGAVAFAAGVAPGCGDLPPRGEVVVVVDTDLPAPALASRLQIDLYTRDGDWYASRSVARPNASDWPLSFGIMSPDDGPDTEVLLRLRVHPDGKVRSYLGERFLPPVTFSPPRAPTSPVELCADAAELELGSSLRLRRGFWPVVDTACTPGSATSGATAAFVDIAEPGTYRFAVTAVTVGEPLGFPYALHATLDVRSDCADALSAVACSDGLGLEPQTYLNPDVTVDLAPGRWFVITSGAAWPEGPADVVVAAAREDSFEAVRPPASEEPPPEVVVEKLLRGDPAATPDREPLPDLTVDRLVRLRVPPERVASASVTLRGACMGTPARLPSEGTPPATCVDEEGGLTPVSVEDLGPGAPAELLPPSVAGTMVHEDGCLPEESSTEVVCIPGGWFVLGGVEGGGFGDASSVPERLAILPRFWIDRHEVTVARYQAALSAGFAGLPGKDASGEEEECAAIDPAQGADFAMTCTSWYAAQAFCEFSGGRLPTEAEWEYVASAAGRSEETIWPWGASAPRCACGADDPGCNCTGRGPECRFAVVERSNDVPDILGRCVDTGDPSTVGPLPVVASAGPHGDVTPLGVVGLAGGVAEMVLDAHHPYDGACWRATRMATRVCLEDFAVVRGARGASWAGTGIGTMAAIRIAAMLPGVVTHDDLGFRCLYPQDPGSAGGRR
jgi:formylglycine-generating enzyme required for sulfatase activity